MQLGVGCAHALGLPFAVGLMAIPLLAAVGAELRARRPAAPRQELHGLPSARVETVGPRPHDLRRFRGVADAARRSCRGSPDQSLVVQFIAGAVKPAMPFNQPPLAANEIATIRDWIAAGAKG